MLLLKHLKARKIFIFLAYLVIYILFLMSAFVDFKSKYMWEDESFTFHIIHHGFLSIMGLTAKDVHPFLYYFIAKIFVTPFDNLFAQIRILRLVSIIPYLILLLIGNISIKKHFSTLTSLLFMFSIITMPILVYNMYEIRMYGWAMLFTTSTFIGLIYIYKGIYSNSIKSFLFITLIGLLAAYTHYYALITIALIYLSFLMLFIISKKKIRYLLSSIGLSIICYLPWIFVLLKQAKDVSKKFWIAPLNSYYLVNLIDNLFIDNVNSRIFQILLHRKVFALVALISIILLIYLIKKMKLSNTLLICLGLCLPFLVLVVGIFISKLIHQNVLIVRYITPSMSIFWLVVSIILSASIKNHNINSLLKFILIIIFLGLGEQSYYYSVSQIKDNSIQFNTTLTQLDKLPNNSRIIYDSSNSMYSMASYEKHNYVLGHLNNDICYHEFYRVYSDIHKKDNLKLHFNKPIYFVYANNGILKSKNGLSKLNAPFMKKYKKHMKKINNIILPSDGGKYKLYKINK